jgi:acyl-CoA oxidase
MGPAEVSEDGTYRKRKGSEKLLYGAMLHVRASLVSKASLAIARALTIAVRYSAVRCQGFEEGATHRERPVLDYPTQQAALLPLVALAYALHFTGQRMHESYTSYLRTSDAAVLPELHAVSSGLKASITYMVADGIEVCRKMCGGHGYSHLSGLPELSHNYLAMCTLEGTREVLEPQCTRYLLRCFADTSTEPLSAEVEYLRRSQELLCFRCDIPSDRELMCTNAEQLLLTLFEARSVRALARARQAQEQANGSAAEAALEAGLEMGTASRAHSQLHMLRSFVIHMQRLEEQRIASESDVDFDGLGAAERAVLRQLLVLFALRVMQDNMNEFRDENLLSRCACKYVCRDELTPVT